MLRDGAAKVPNQKRSPGAFKLLIAVQNIRGVQGEMNGGRNTVGEDWLET